MTFMRDAIRASGDRKSSAVELLIERLVPFEQRPPARPIVQLQEIHRGAAPLQLSLFVLYSGALRNPFIEFGCFMHGSVSTLWQGSRHDSANRRGSCCHSCILPLASRCFVASGRGLVCVERLNCGHGRGISSEAGGASCTCTRAELPGIALRSHGHPESRVWGSAPREKSAARRLFWGFG